MTFNFDKKTNRCGTDCLKYDFAVKCGKASHILPLWVADMDFEVPQAVQDALIERARHGIFGYSDAAGNNYFEAVSIWYQRRFGWQLRPEWLIKSPSVVFAICAAMRALTQEGDAVMIQQPVYYPFAGLVRDNHRELVVNQLVYQEGKYSLDLQEFEQKIIDHKVKLFILCSPHNPVGRVWTQEELTAMGDICVRHGVRVVADEIHADFVYPGYRHTVFAGIKDAFSQISITCTAPTKTFNLAGLQISNIWVPNQTLRRILRREIRNAGYSQPNVMGLVACRAAYEHGAEWLEALKVYLQQNLSFIKGFLEERLPQIHLVEPEGTYLIWLDCRALGLSDEALHDLIEKRAGLWLDEGIIFGAGGQGFQRINIACTRATLKKALQKFANAIDALSSGAK